MKRFYKNYNKNTPFVTTTASSQTIYASTTPGYCLNGSILTKTGRE